MKATAAVIIVSCLAIVPATAQNVPSPDEAKVIRINANFQLSVPIEASATTADIAKPLAQANDALTDLAARQCDLMAASFKRECRVAQINLGANLNGRRLVPQLSDEANLARRFANANMNLSMELLPPSDAATTAPAAK
jgi:hypothetical protein